MDDYVPQQKDIGTRLQREIARLPLMKKYEVSVLPEDEEELEDFKVTVTMKLKITGT